MSDRRREDRESTGREQREQREQEGDERRREDVERRFDDLEDAWRRHHPSKHDEGGKDRGLARI